MSRTPDAANEDVFVETPCHCGRGSMIDGDRVCPLALAERRAVRCSRTNPPSAAIGRTPTERQYRTLLCLGSGNVLLTGTKGTVEPLVRHGWVTSDHGYAWVRITADGLHALARAVAKYGLPEMSHGNRYEEVCSRCEKPWKPKCACGSQSYRLVPKEYERAAA